MAGSSLLARVANRVVGGVLNDGYYPFAAQRRLTEATTPTAIDDAMVFARGMLRYEPAEPFLTTLRRGGFA